MDYRLLSATDYKIEGSALENHDVEDNDTSAKNSILVTIAIVVLGIITVVAVWYGSVILSIITVVLYFVVLLVGHDYII